MASGTIKLPSKHCSIIREQKYHTFSAANTYEDIGIKITIPAKSRYSFIALHNYENTVPTGICWLFGDVSSYSEWRIASESKGCMASLSGYAPATLTFTLFGKTNSTNTGNSFIVDGWYEKV